MAPYASPARDAPDAVRARFVFAMQHRLLERALAAWPRRNATLLAVNCGSGLFLPLLWHCGFDVDGAEREPALRARAALRCPRASLLAGSDDALPVDDDGYDWVLLHLRTQEGLPRAVAEAARVARRGVAVTFWNRLSLAGVCVRFSGAHARSVAAGKTVDHEGCAAWWTVRGCLRGLGHDRIESFSTLAGPPATWRRDSPLAGCNGWFSGLPVGAWCVLRCDLRRPGTLTPLALRLDAPLESRLNAGLPPPEPALECRNNHADSCAARRTP